MKLVLRLSLLTKVVRELGGAENKEVLMNEQTRPHTQRETEITIEFPFITQSLLLLMFRVCSVDPNVNFCVVCCVFAGIRLTRFTRPASLKLSTNWFFVPFNTFFLCVSFGLVLA